MTKRESFSRGASSKRSIIAAALLLGACMFGAALASESLAPSHEMNWFTVDAGGGIMTGNGFTLTGTVGQMDASLAMTGTTAGSDSVSFSAGFWHGVSPMVQCPGDVSPLGGDGVVNIDDLLLVIAAWGTSNPQFDVVLPAPPGAGGPVMINMDDLLALIAAWGMCPT